MKCEDVNRHWDDYINNRCTSEIEEQIDAHIEGCDQCENRLAQAVTEQKEINKEQIQTPTNQISKRMIRRAKMKHRLSMSFTFVLLGIMFVILCSLLTAFFYSWNDKIDRVRLVNQTYFQMTSPNMVLDHGIYSTTPFFKVNYDYNVYKIVGRDQQLIGTYEPYLLFNQYTNYQFPEELSLTDLHFVNRHVKDHYDDYNQIWPTLEKLPEGTVSEVAVTFTDALTYDQLFAMIKKYDIALVWGGIETRTKYHMDPEVLYVGMDVIGMHEKALFDLSEVEGINKIEEYDSAVREKIVKESLQYLIDNNGYLKKLNRNSIRALDAKSAMAYIEKHGVQLYGAILTGPTKELLKLQNEAQILYSDLGEVEFWNWDY
jgi:hypothetical protein